MHFKPLRWIFQSFLMLALVGMPSLPVYAARVTPMIVELEAEGRGAVARIELTNDADRDLAYEVEVARGVISPTGELMLTPANEDFLIFPPQSLVEANSRQVFRIQYLSEEPLQQSELYYLTIKQVPVAFEPGESMVQVVVNFNVLVHVTPKGTLPAPTVISSKFIEREVMDAEDPSIGTGEFEQGILVDLGNEGTRYYYAGLSDWVIKAKAVSGEDFMLEFTGKAASRLTGAGVVAPGRNRQFFIPTTETLQSETITIEIQP